LRTSLVNLDIADARENFNAIVDLKNWDLMPETDYEIPHNSSETGWKVPSVVHAMELDLENFFF
jgi:hypothetical protein